MSTLNYAGYWTGIIEGTNHGGFTLDLKQDGQSISGIAKFSEPQLGQYEYLIDGLVADPLALRLTPHNHRGINLGKAQVIGSINADGKLEGRWKTDIGTEGIFLAKRADSKKLAPELPKSNSVFLVHGHDEGVKHSVARFLEQLGVVPVILQEQINKGMTVIEKFEDFAARAGFAVVLMTPDDFGYPVSKEEDKKHRPRQNVVLELGYFAAHLGRSKTFVLVKGNIEMPSDVLGLVYEQMDNNEGWKMRLARELKAAGFEIDLNRAIS
ncbi:MAG: nucleotide-binding protein [Methylovulum miyakonense]|uniref:TIR domain-containing protein n=1 Tax=Methylovulum miyakonense TaxID=645578 RepID=UPI003BB78D74